MIDRYINKSIYSVDNFFQSNNWLYRLKINDYQIVTIFWNLALMVVPWLATLIMIKLWQETRFKRLGAKLAGLALFFVWLIFIPNTAYVMTEVRHLIDYCPRDSQFQVCVPNAWMSIFFFIYACFGWVFFVYLINQQRALIEQLWNRTIGWLFTIVLIPMIALGLLLGLLNRWNSWEFFIYPLDFFRTIPVYWQEEAYFTNWLFFTIFLYILYWVGRQLFKESWGR